MPRLPVKGLIDRLLSLWVKPTVLPSDPVSLLHGANTNTPALYVFEHNSRTDLAALKIVCTQHQLPDPDSGFQLEDLCYPSSTDVLKRRRRRLLNKSAFVSSDKYGALLKHISENSNIDCLLIPVSVYWGQEPERQNSFWKVFFSEHWEITGRTRKFLITLVHGRHTLLRFSEPISLRRFLAESVSEQTDHSTARLERKLQRLLRVHFRRRRRATLGPDMSHRRMLIQHVVADTDVRQQINLELSRGSNNDVNKLAGKAEHYAEEIAADMSHRTARLLHRVLTRLWNSLYDGVELAGLQKLDKIVEGHEIVYVPCHRSHIDYLLLSYILYVNGYSLPHIAAGLNLNLPVIGGILRRGGAFFLRRSFAGNKLYAAVFNTYLKELVQRGHSLEYFIEGGRSRTGLLLPAKPGMLSMTVQAYLSEPIRPIQFVPVYFGYEKLLEGRSFTNELAGGKKRKESLLGLFKALKTLREDYGHVYVSVGEPIALNSRLDEYLPNWKQKTQDQVDTPASTEAAADDAIPLIKSENYRLMVSMLGKQILTNINAAVSVTPVSLVASLLLAAPGRSSGQSELQDQLELIHQLLTNLHPNTEKNIPPAKSPANTAAIILPELQPEAWIEKTLQLGFLKLEKSELGKVVKIKPKQMTTLMYFRNNILHTFVVPSLVACVLTQQRSVSKARLERLILQAWPVLSAQYYMDIDASQHFADHAISAMEKTGLLDIENNRVQRPSGRSLQSVLLIRLATIVRPTIERSFLAAAILAEFREGIELKEYEHRFRIAANRFAMTEARDPNELYNRASFQTLVDSLLATDAVEMLEDNLCANSVLQSLEFEIRQVLPDATRHEMLAAARLAAHCTIKSKV